MIDFEQVVQISDRRSFSVEQLAERKPVDFRRDPVQLFRPSVPRLLPRSIVMNEDADPLVLKEGDCFDGILLPDPDIHTGAIRSSTPLA